MRRLLLLVMACGIALPTHAATYYVVVAGLGGEADYEQRFTAAAKDLDRILTSAAPAAHVYLLTGMQATSRQLSETMSEVARNAKADDDFALILIGHGSFDGVEYKFNLVGPDVTAREIAAMCDRIVARRQLIVDTTSRSGGLRSSRVIGLRHSKILQPIRTRATPLAQWRPSVTPRRRPQPSTIRRNALRPSTRFLMTQAGATLCAKPDGVKVR